MSNPNRPTKQSACFPYFELNHFPTSEQIDKIAEQVGCIPRTVMRGYAKFRKLHPEIYGPAAGKIPKGQSAKSLINNQAKTSKDEETKPYLTVPKGIGLFEFAAKFSYPFYPGLFAWQKKAHKTLWESVARFLLLNAPRDHGKSIYLNNLFQWLMDPDAGDEEWDILYLGWTDRRKEVAEFVYNYFIIRGLLQKDKKNSEYHFRLTSGARFDTYLITSKDTLGKHSIGNFGRVIDETNEILKEYIREDNGRKLLICIDDPIDITFMDERHKEEGLERKFDSTIYNINPDRFLFCGTKKFEDDFFNFIESKFGEKLVSYIRTPYDSPDLQPAHLSTEDEKHSVKIQQEQAPTKDELIGFLKQRGMILTKSKLIGYLKQPNHLSLQKAKKAIETFFATNDESIGHLKQFMLSLSNDELIAILKQSMKGITKKDKTPTGLQPNHLSSEDEKQPTEGAFVTKKESIGVLKQPKLSSTNEQSIGHLKRSMMSATSEDKESINSASGRDATDEEQSAIDSASGTGEETIAPVVQLTGDGAKEEQPAINAAHAHLSTYEDKTPIKGESMSASPSVSKSVELKDQIYNSDGSQVPVASKGKDSTPAIVGGHGNSGISYYGHILCPERFTTPELKTYSKDLKAGKKDLNAIRHDIGEYMWSAEYCQNPHPVTGEVWDKVKLVKVQKAWPNYDILVISLDRATTTNPKSSYTGYTVELRENKTGERLVINDFTGLWEFEELLEDVNDYIVEFHQTYKNIDIYLVIEKQGGGEDFYNSAKGRNFRFLECCVVVLVWNVREKKERIKNYLYAPIKNERIKFLEALRNSELVKEILQFPHGLRLDAIDALANAEHEMDIAEVIPPPGIFDESNFDELVVNLKRKYLGLRTPEAIQKDEFGILAKQPNFRLKHWRD